jgi:hypothetical protein
MRIQSREACFRQPSAAAVILADRRRDRDKPALSHSRAKRARTRRARALSSMYENRKLPPEIG